MMCLAVQCFSVQKWVCRVVTFYERTTVGSGRWDVVIPAAATSICPWGSVSPHCIVLICVIWWSLGGRSFGHFYILPGREEEWWPYEGLVFTHVVVVVDMVSCGYGDFGCESATRFQSYWKKSSLWHQQGNPSAFKLVRLQKGQWSLCKKFIPELPSIDIAF